MSFSLGVPYICAAGDISPTFCSLMKPKSTAASIPLLWANHSRRCPSGSKLRVRSTKKSCCGILSAIQSKFVIDTMLLHRVQEIVQHFLNAIRREDMFLKLLTLIAPSHSRQSHLELTAMQLPHRTSRILNQSYARTQGTSAMYPC